MHGCTASNCQLFIQLQDALSDVGSSFQRYSQKASALIGSRRQSQEAQRAALSSFLQLQTKVSRPATKSYPAAPQPRVKKHL